MVINSKYRFFILLTGFTLIIFNSYSQTRLDTLLEERKILHKDYYILKAQKSSFWGSQSKNDLKNIINNLKDIINKDDEMIREINRQHLVEKVEVKKKSNHQETNLTLKERNLTNRLSELKRELGYANTQLFSKTKEFEKLKRKIQNEKTENSTVERIMALFFFISIGLGIYIIRLRKKIENLKEEQAAVK
jgi:CRISPR/Cas system-associated endoribonuclease Cas2